MRANCMLFREAEAVYEFPPGASASYQRYDLPIYQRIGAT